MRKIETAMNRRKEAMQKHFNWIENPIRYCLEFMGHDVDTDVKCYQGLYINLEKCYDPELHFQWAILTESEQTSLDSVGFLEVTDDLLDRMFPQESRLDHTQESRLDHTQTISIII